ncbi:hypothetical protein J3E69DRAFT_333674 [Trichoderma sp. SZMC 28015]
MNRLLPLLSLALVPVPVPCTSICMCVPRAQRQKPDPVLLSSHKNVVLVGLAEVRRLVSCRLTANVINGSFCGPVPAGAAPLHQCCSGGLFFFFTEFQARFSAYPHPALCPKPKPKSQFWRTNRYMYAIDCGLVTRTWILHCIVRLSTETQDSYSRTYMAGVSAVETVSEFVPSSSALLISLSLPLSLSPSSRLRRPTASSSSSSSSPSQYPK